ncbi:MAG: sigma-54-dependent Fis family transcriptional regulator [Desulfobacteraceae bacterium]|nr:MAG: sigma-54-dependent Fis family transcriptional regulator [Desulfobacteraceae bacterium]
MVISSVPDDIATIRNAFGPEFRFSTAADLPAALRILDRVRYDLIFADLDILTGYTCDSSPESALQLFQQRYPAIELVIMTSPAQIRKAVGWVKAGARDYVSYPISRDEIRLVADSIAQSILRQSELDYLRDKFWKTDALDVVQTRSKAMVEVFKKIRSVASTKTTVLLVGETGTGKGIMAKLIHQHSNRQGAQFISVHCGAIPDSLLESELFGHEKGAFTGAVRKKLGKFEISNGGTIFLDEIGTLTPPAQIKLLQVLQDGTFSRVGGEETIQTNARVIAATNSNLKQLSEAGEFRKDLYYRLNVFPIEIPSLRERAEDLPHLIEVFLKRLNREFQKSIHGVHPQVIAGLSHYDWPGNVRELENLLERAYILENSNILTPESFPLDLFEGQNPSAVVPLHSRMPLAEARKVALEDFERQYLKDLVARNQGRINISASEAGISTRQLHKLMSRYGIRKEEFKHDAGVK